MANFFSANGLTGNPYAASNCPGKGLIATASGTCRTDTVAYIDDIPKAQQESLLGKATFKLSADNIATLEYLHSRSTSRAAAVSAPAGMSPRAPG